MIGESMFYLEEEIIYYGMSEDGEKKEVEKKPVEEEAKAEEAVEESPVEEEAKAEEAVEEFPVEEEAKAEEAVEEAPVEEEVPLDPKEVEYVANQTREEARHVTGFSKYVKARWGKPLPVGQTLGDLLCELVEAQEVYKKIVGMQILVEGLAMGAFATLYQNSNDPLLVKLCQLVMTDEAFHHKFGKIWASKTIPMLDEKEQNIIEDWAAHCFQVLLFNLVNPEQKKIIYEKFGLDWKSVLEELHEIISDDSRRKAMENSTNIFRVLIKTLLNSGIITDRTKDFYSTYVDIEELKKEGDRMVGDDIAEEGIKYLTELNFKDHKNSVKTVAAE